MMTRKTAVIDLNYNDKNDSPNKLIIVKKSRQTDQNDKSCKKNFSYISFYIKNIVRE